MDLFRTSKREREAQPVAGLTTRSKSFYSFTLQTLPACRSVLTPSCVISIFVLMGALSITVGLLVARASKSVYEIVDRYDADCVPDSYRNNELAYIKDDSVPKNCTRYLKIRRHMKAPVYIYYQLENFYQNHRRYVKSRSDNQLLKGAAYHQTGTCDPEEYSNHKPIVPCGLIAWSLFNDTYTFTRGATKMNVNRKGIAWESDREHKFGKKVHSFNFQSGGLIGGGKLDPHIPLSEQEDLIVWMRTAALPNFRKLYGKIHDDLDEGDVVVVNLMNNYNTYLFGGKKKLVLTTENWLGGANNFLGVAYIFVGALCLIVSLVIAFLHIRYPR